MGAARPKSTCDLSCQFTLEPSRIGNGPIITFSPQGPTVARISEVHIDKQPIRDAPHTSFEDVGDVELLADLAQVTVRPRTDSS